MNPCSVCGGDSGNACVCHQKLLNASAMINFHPTMQLRWLKRATQAALERGKPNVSHIEQKAGYAATETVLQQLWISDIGQPEWRDVPVEDEQ